MLRAHQTCVALFDAAAARQACCAGTIARCPLTAQPPLRLDSIETIANAELLKGELIADAGTLKMSVQLAGLYSTMLTSLETMQFSKQRGSLQLPRGGFTSTQL